MNTRIKKVFSVLLVICLLASSFSYSILSVSAEEGITQREPQAEITTPVEPEVTVVREEMSLRGEYEKHFLMSDGTYQAVVYSCPIHELVNGIWVEIENQNQNARSDISTDDTQQNIIDNYVWENHGVQDSNLMRLYIGNKSGDKARAYIQFANMPTIPDNATISEAVMTLNIVSGTTSAYNINAYQVTGSEWTSSSIQWSNMPAADVLLESNISHNEKTMYQFSCLSAVQHWYDGDTTGQNENYGIMLRYYDESISDYNSVYSADTINPNMRPSLTITYGLFSDADVDIGETITLTASDTTGPVTWSSADSSIATINTEGVVTGIKAGKTTITGYVDNEVYMTVTLYVTVADGVYQIRNDCYMQYIASHATENGRTVDVTDGFGSNDELVDQYWKITYLGEGYYSIRPAFDLEWGLFANGIEGSSIGIQNMGTLSNDLINVEPQFRWSLTQCPDSNNYYIDYNGDRSLGLWMYGTWVGLENNTGSGKINRFEWELTCITPYVVNLDVIYDQAYLSRYSDASNRISSQISALQMKYLTEFGIWVECGSPSEFYSYADVECTTNPTQVCTHATNSECMNSILYISGNTKLYTYHHNNIYNIMLRIPLPDLSHTVRMAYIGHNICRTYETTVSEDGKIVTETVHQNNPYWGLTYSGKGLMSITNFGTAQNETKTMLHEFGHLFGAPDHYGGSQPSTDDLKLEDERFSSYCIYGEDRNSTEVLQNLTICEGCKARIEQNKDTFDHN